ncbi:leukocyte receptor cluster member 1 [Tanacetum coccineum]
MGGHGGLNILPQKRWNVYNFDNREKVRKDEEAAAKDEQIKREQSRKQDTELRLQHLRQSRGLLPPSTSSSAPPDPKPEPKEEANSKHINLFEGIRIFDPASESVKKDVDKSELVLGNELRRGLKKMRKEAAEEPKPVLPEDEKYRLGYGVAGKGVKLPWYMDNSRKQQLKDDDAVRGRVDNDDDDDSEMVSRKRKKKSVEELREERLKREAREKERERALLRPKGSFAHNDRGGGGGGYSSKTKSKHINLFEGIRIFDLLVVKMDNKNNKSELVLGSELRRGRKKMKEAAEEPMEMINPTDPMMLQEKAEPAKFALVIA